MIKLSEKVTDPRAIKGFKSFVECVNNAEGYEAFGEYVNSNFSKVLIRCPKGHEYFVLPGNFKRGNRCPICAGLSSKHAKEDFIKEVKESGYTLIGPYVNARTKVKLLCKEEHEYSVFPSHFKGGLRCPYCAKKIVGEKNEK